MLGEFEIRAARLAVSRYGVDPCRVQQILHTVLAAQARGESLDLLDELTREKLLARRHADDIRHGLDQTQLDDGPAAPPGPEPQPAVATLPRTSKPPALLAAALDDLQQLERFRILCPLGEGGMGSVFLAHDPREDRHVALKVLLPEHAGVPGIVDRFQREADSGLALHHPNIVRNDGIGHDPETGLHYLVLEYVDGPSAQELLLQHDRLRVDDAVYLILEIARGLEYAHRQGIVHRDIKPGNILLTSTGVPKLSDLGLSKRLDATKHLTSTRQGIGTPYYMPFEQALSAKQADERSDLYALGATLYHLVTGEVPFPGQNTVEILDKKEMGVYLPARFLNPEAPEALDSILDRLLALRPQDRYQTASELIVALERTGLAADVPSFVERSAALKDPHVQKRLASVLPPTALDIELARKASKTQRADLWFVRCRDRQGKVVKAKLTTAEVKQRLRLGKLTPRSRIARTSKGAYQPLASFAEFADALRRRRKQPAGATEKKPPPATPPHWYWALALMLGVGILGLVVATAFCCPS